MGYLILVRHGESEWNQANRFTGWVNVALSENGEKEASRVAPSLETFLARHGVKISEVFTSVLKRAIQTERIITDALGIQHLSVYRTYRLNERHYGALQGLNKKEVALKYGEDQVKLWRRSLSTRPPLLELTDPMHPQFDPLYAGIPATSLPRGESLEDTIFRVEPLWREHIEPRLREGKVLLIVAHGNSLRALHQFFLPRKPEDLMNFEIATGAPLFYRLSFSYSVEVLT